MDAPQNMIMDTALERESGVGSNDSSSGGEMNSGEDASFSSWSSSNSCESGPDFFGEDDLCHSSEGYGTDSGLSPNSVQPCTTLHWVRMSSLRIHDNASLSEAMLNSKTRFRAVFIVDPWFASGEKKFGVNRWRFLLECLHDLDKRLKEYNTRLYVAKGHPVAILERLCTTWNVTELTFQQDGEIRSNILEEAVEKLGEQKNIKVVKRPGHTLYDTNKLLESVGHRQIATIKDFKEVLHLAEKPGSPIKVPPVSITNYEEQLPEEFQIPTLQDLGFAGNECLYSNKGGWIGGETMALKRLEEYCKVRSGPPSDSFVDVLFDKSSLSPYIRFGCLSVRHFLYHVKQLASKDSSAEALLKDVTGKLLQREFYFTVAKQVPNFDSYDNDISFQLPWEKDRHLFSLWKNGKTGYPWIDAAMNQLHREGWIHLCLRESVASFLTRGDLWISWVWGKDTFEELMLDFEVAVSSGCWMKSSCSAFITGPVEHFCPVTYGKQIDPTGIYVRTYCPELKNFPDKYIYCPWMAPLEVQKAAGCRIGINYPNPIIDHATAGFLCCEKLRSVMDMVHQRPRPSSLKTSTNRLHPHHPCHTHAQQQLQHHPAYSSFLGALQTHLHRYHPYSQPRNTNLLSFAQADSLLNPVAGENKSSSEESLDTLCTNTNDRPSPECTVCSSADNLMTQLLLHERQDHQEGSSVRLQASRRRSLTSPPLRARRRTPPSVCSHKLSNFAGIT